MQLYTAMFVTVMIKMYFDTDISSLCVVHGSSLFIMYNARTNISVKGYAAAKKRQLKGG